MSQVAGVLSSWQEERTLEAEEWSLKRYGRLGRAKESEENSAWMVFESDEESGNLTLTILNSGHFFISQGQTMLEGFSLIAAQTWLKVGKKSDCLLFQSKARQEFRMFRVQFNGESSEQSLENCLNCVQKLQMYVPVQNGTPLEALLNVTEERIPVAHIAEALLNPQNKQLGIAYQDLFLSTEELGPFIKLCLLDQHFPAFVETVEEELYKLKEG